MGVYINMEMPENCALCPVWDAGNCLVATEAIICEYTKRPSDCPLVPVPPHGDLIDRNTAYDSLLDGMVMTGYQSRALDCISDFYVPTIIPAEEGET